MTFRYKSKGFTLLELLTTLVIAGVAMALVAPLAVEQVSKMEARSEVARLNDQVGRWSFMAFSRGCPLNVAFEGNRISLTSKSCDLSDKVELNYISFPRQDITFSSSGYTNSTFLTYTQPSDGKPHRLKFSNDLVNVIEEGEK